MQIGAANIEVALTAAHERQREVEPLLCNTKCGNHHDRPAFNGCGRKEPVDRFDNDAADRDQQ